MAKIKATIKAADTILMNRWDIQHNEAIDWPKGLEAAIVKMLLFWEMYAKEHQKRNESPIGDDYVLGPEWRDIGLAIRGLLNGETGRLDCGTLDAFILETMRENGVETEGI